MMVQFLLAGLLFFAPAQARSVDGVALSVDELQRRAGLIESYQAHFEPGSEAGTAFLQGHDHERGTCLTSLVAELQESWHLFDADERRAMTAKIAPSKVDLLDPIAPAMGGDSAMAPPGACWGSQKDNTITTDHFSVQWDDGVVSESTAQAFADSLEFSYDVEIDELGWRPPSGLPTYQIMVLIESGGTMGAYTTVDSCLGRYMPYIVAYAGSFSGGSWYQTMACHELHHAVQFGYGYAHEFWYWEASATWMEDHVYPDLNDWANALYVYSLVPYMGMNASGRSSDYLFMHTYAMGIWGNFLDQHIGGNELVMQTWEAGQSMSCQYCLWMPDAIESLGYDFDELYSQFIATNAVMDYSDQVYLQSPTLTDEVDSLPASGESDYRDRPQSLGQNFIRFERGLGGSDQALEVTFEGKDSPDYWVAVLVRGNFSVEEIVVFELDADGRGTARIDFDGDSYVHLVVSPVDEDAQGYYYNWENASDFDYEWTAQIVDSDSDIDGDDDGEGGGDETDPSFSDSDESGSTVVGKQGTGCACSSTGPANLGWLGLLIGLVPLARRRVLGAQ